jgi:DNA-binding NtrC family response regulator
LIEVKAMKKSVFYFDDNAMLLDIFQEMFEDRYDIRTTTKLAVARRMLSECAADIIITDQSMPEISGSEFLREAIVKCPRSFRIMLTGYAVVGDMSGDVANGLINIFITKPWNEEQMKQALEHGGAAVESQRNSTSD